VLKFEDLAEKVKGKRPNAQEKVVSDDEDNWDDEEEGAKTRRWMKMKRLTYWRTPRISSPQESRRSMETASLW